MFSLTSALVVAVGAASVLAAPAEAPVQIAKRSSPNSSGNNNGFYYQFCKP